MKKIQWNKRKTAQIWQPKPKHQKRDEDHEEQQGQKEEAKKESSKEKGIVFNEPVVVNQTVNQKAVEGKGKEIVNEDLIKNPKCYNIILGGGNSAPTGCVTVRFRNGDETQK